MKFIKTFIATVFMASIAFSAKAVVPGPYFAYVQEGGQTVSTSGQRSLTNVQRSFPSSTVKVCVASTGCSASGGTLAVLASDSSGTPLGNPLTSGLDGSFKFWSNTATFDIVFYGKGITTQCGLSGQLPCISAFTWANQTFNSGGGGVVAPLPYVFAAIPSGGDDEPALQALINTYSPLSTLIILQAGTYLVNTELTTFTGSPLYLQGFGQNYLGSGGTTIKANASIRSVLNINSSYSQITNLKFDANQQATYGIYSTINNLGKFTNTYTTNAIKDGMFLTTSGMTDTNIFDGCWWVSNGTVYVTNAISGQHASQRTFIVNGTATVTASNATITIVGSSTDFTTLGLRKGDFIRTGSGAKNAASTYAGQISSVTATTIVLEGAATNLPTAAQAGSGLDYAIGSGDGWHENIAANNNLNNIRGGLARGNASFGYAFHGLFGPTVVGTQADGNGFGAYAIGDADNSSAVNQASFIHPYSETDNGYGDFFYGDVVGLSIISPTLGVGRNYPVLTDTMTGVVIKDNLPESIQLGIPQNFLLEFRNNAGTIQHRIIAEHWGGFASLQAGKVIGESVTWTNTPTVDATHNFATGVGIYDAGGVFEPILNVLLTQNRGISGVVALEYLDVSATSGTAITAGALYRPSLTTSSINVNGTTTIRPSIFISDNTGTINSIDTTTLPAGKSIGIRVQLLVK